MRGSKDPHEQLKSKSLRAARLAEKNKKLFRDLASEMEKHEEALEASAAALAAADDIKVQIEANRTESDSFRSQMASLTVAKSEAAPPDLAATAEAAYNDLLGEFNNPLLADDSTVAAEKAKLETVYQTLSDTFAEMAKDKATLRAAAEPAAAKGSWKGSRHNTTGSRCGS